MQYTVGVAGGVPVSMISVGSQTTDNLGGFLDMIESLISQDSPPQVVTTSFALEEPGIPQPIAEYEISSAPFYFRE